MSPKNLVSSGKHISHGWFVVRAIALGLLLLQPMIVVAADSTAQTSVKSPDGKLEVDGRSATNSTTTPLQQPSTLNPSVIVQTDNSWSLESHTLRAIVKFDRGSIDLVNLINKRTGNELLSGAGPRRLFRHVVDGVELTANDGKWALGKSTVTDINAFNKQWGKSLFVELTRTDVKLSISLVFEIYNGDSGLRYGSFIRNDDTTCKRVISASDILTLNIPDSKHTIDYVPWQTKWSSTEGGLEKAKRNCLLRYDNGEGLAILPENNWCTSLTPGAEQGDPDNPFLFMNVFAGGDAGVRIFTNPKAVQLTLFPGERFEYFWVNLQPFTGDALDGRGAVAEHFRRSFKYHDALPQMEFQEYNFMYFQNDAMARKHLLPALAETGMDRWEVTWTWNGAYSSDAVEPKPQFTKDLSALSDYANSLGVKMGYYFTMHSSLKKPHRIHKYGWGDGGDLADPAFIAYKRARVENILIPNYRSTWQMIDLGELWLNDQPTSYSHPSDNVYRKFVNLRNYISDVARKHPDFTLLTTCEVENPSKLTNRGPRSAQCVSLMLIGENGQAGAYKRTDGATGFGTVQANLRDAMNYIGLMPLESCVQVHGEDAKDPQPGMFTQQAVYASLLGGCSTYYSDVRRWTPEQRKFLRKFNDWRKSPGISALLREVAHPLAIGKDNQGPYAWIYTNPATTEALLIALGFDSKSSDFTLPLRTLDDTKTYLVMEKPPFVDGNATSIYRGAFTGAQLKHQGLPIALDQECATAFLLSEKNSDNSRNLGPAIVNRKLPVNIDKVNNRNDLLP